MRGVLDVIPIPNPYLTTVVPVCVKFFAPKTNGNGKDSELLAHLWSEMFAKWFVAHISHSKDNTR